MRFCAGKQQPVTADRPSLRAFKVGLDKNLDDLLAIYVNFGGYLYSSPAVAGTRRTLNCDCPRVVRRRRRRTRNSQLYGGIILSSESAPELITTKFSPQRAFRVGHARTQILTALRQRRFAAHRPQPASPASGGREMIGRFTRTRHCPKPPRGAERLAHEYLPQACQGMGGALRRDHGGRHHEL